MHKRGASLIQILLAALIVALLLTPISFYFSREEKKVFLAPQPNTPPVFENIEKEIFACEGSSLSYIFEATDLNENFLTFDISPKYKDPFFVRKISADDTITTQAEIFSGTLTKEHANQEYPKELYVSDGQYIDTAATKIIVIEVNNPPIVEKLNVQTIVLEGKTVNYKKQVKAADIESKYYPSNKLTYGLSFLSGEPIFDINPVSGVIDTQLEVTEIGNYNIEICAVDLGIKNIHEKIDLCKLDSSEKLDCENFQLTVTNLNKQPTIDTYYPLLDDINISGNQTLSFNISKFDADGTNPEVYWYIDNYLQQIEQDKLIYSFGCGIAGKHKIKAEITDGKLNDSVLWNINVRKSECQIKPRETSCVEKWGCYDWNLCQNAFYSFDNEIIQLQDYEKIKGECEEEGFANEVCGFQIRDCFELSSCNTTFYEEPEIQACYFILEPSCSDSIKNCHDSGCEKEVDCGSPCSDCSTCSDGIRNQGEESIDCGSPCLKLCPTESTLLELLLGQKVIKYTIFTILLAALLIIVIQVLSIIKVKNELKKVIARLNKKGNKMPDEMH